MQLQNLTNKERIFTVKYDDDVTLQLRHISREELRDIFKEASVTRFVNHQKTEEFDPLKADCLLGRAVITGWSGVKDGDQDAPCTPETIDILMTSHNTFAKFINDICTDIDQLVQQEKEAARKN